MTNRAQITRQAARDGVPAPTVERDYVLAHPTGDAVEQTKRNRGHCHRQRDPPEPRRILA